MSASSHIGLSSSGTSVISSSIWVLDSGASHHMSTDLSSFASLSHNSSIEIVTDYDVWGPSPVLTKGRSRYYVSFIDDCNRYCWVYLMKHRSDYLAIFNDFKALVKNQHSTVIKCFRYDLGGEYTSNDFSHLLASDGTICQTSCRETPDQNGVAERKYRHIVETARSFLLSSNFPSAFWGEAILTAVHVINKIPTSHNSDPVLINPLTSDTDETLPTTTPETPAPQNPPTTTQSSPGIAYNPPLHHSFASFVASVHCLSEPLSYREAVGNTFWQKAMAEELTALHQTQTWDLVLLPPGKHTIGSRWVYKIKTKSDGSIERYKARLVAKGYF
ncbi:uncharacterized protein [Primulina huaijiensis]|uniref:uncharacterized protein n=1 Tax=Primulina huaijiensis TaxID=1492673 RepID=UPI003CC71A33